MASENQKCVGVVFSDRAYKDIQTETYDKDPVETGGILLGHVLSTGHWVVVEVIPPGDNSTHQYAYFEYDEHFVNRVADQIAGKYEQKLELLGLWHRHPGSMDFFSGTDDGTNIKFAEINPDYGAISGLVNIDPEFRMTMYHVDSPLNYTKVETFVGDDIIPAELLKLKEGVTFEDIDAIKKPKIRSEQQPSPQQTRQTPQQTTSSREESRRTTQNRENHEKPQVVIQRPETGTDFFKKLILGHPKAFFALVGFMAVFVCLIGLYVVGKRVGDEEYDKEIKPIWEKYEEAVQKEDLKSRDLEIYISQLQGLNLKSKENEAKRKEKENIIRDKKKELEEKEQEEANRSSSERIAKEGEKTKQKEAEAKKAEEERKTEEAKAEQAKAKAKKAEEARKAEEAKAGAQNKSVKNEAIPEQQGSAEQGGNDKNSEIPDADVAPAKPEDKTEEVGSQPKEPVAVNPPASKETKNTPPDGNGKNEKKCKNLLEQDTGYKKAQRYYGSNKWLTQEPKKNERKIHENALNVLEKLKKYKNCSAEETEVQELINKTNPDILSSSCKQGKCDACKILKRINRSEDKNIWENKAKECNI